MTGLLTGLSGQFPRRLVLGTLLPVMVFVVAAMALLALVVPERWSVAQEWSFLGARWQLELAALVTVLLTGLLYVLNVPLIRLYEGYPWSDSWIGRTLRQRVEKRMSRELLLERLYGLVVRILVNRSPADPRLGDIRRQRDAASRRVLDYPKRESLLPTKLGNIIRAFENYPERQYRMSGIDLWPRLSAKLPDTFATSLDTTKTHFDFMVNASFLSGVLGILSLGVAVLAPYESKYEALREIGLASGSLVLFVAFYRGSIGRAKAWGEVVKAAFDLHRHDLLRALGVTEEPATLLEERALWREISLQIVYTDPWDRSPPSLRFQPPSPLKCPGLTSERGSTELELTRGVMEWDGSSLLVILSVFNPTDKAWHGLEVVDFLRPGWEYEWGTAKAENSSVRVYGINPLRFVVARMPSKGTEAITYKTVRTGPRVAQEEAS